MKLEYFLWSLTVILVGYGFKTCLSDHPEHTDLSFQYEPDSRMFGVKFILHRKRQCYAYNMTESEHSLIHTPGGLTSVESTVLTLVTNATHLAHITHRESISQISRNFANFCGNTAVYLLN
ncbi:uncharacterized protein LOC134684569 [Mytilus trossulus]|uniref:uncharacterized protein LOC134684569 n=1 Tax=Mytilus trossulus TaxID=6551 RepID=UPI0030059D75